MKICELETCSGETINTSNLLYLDSKDFNIKKLNGDVALNLNIDYNSIIENLKLVEQQIKDLHCENINEDVLNELDSFRQLLKKCEEEFQKIHSDITNIRLYFIEEIRKAYKDFMKEYKDYVAKSESKIDKNIQDGIDEIEDIIRRFKIYVEDAYKKIDTKTQDSLDDLDIHKQELSDSLTTQIEGIEKRIDEVNNDLDDLVTHDEMKEIVDGINDTLDNKLHDIDNRIDDIETDNEKFKNDINANIRKIADEEIKSKVTDKLSTVGGHSLLGGGNIDTNKSRYYDLNSRGNLSQGSAINIVKSMIKVDNGDIIVIRWGYTRWIRSGYSGYYRRSYTTRRFIIKNSSWISF